MLQKSGKNDIADSEFCEERRMISENEKTTYFSLGALHRIRYGRIPAALIPLIKQFP